jgi:hypothetical protein
MDQSDAIQRIVEERELFDPEILKAFVRAHENGTLTLKTSTANNRPEADEAGGDKAAEEAAPAKAKAPPPEPAKTRKPERLGRGRPKGR